MQVNNRSRWLFAAATAVVLTMVTAPAAARASAGATIDLDAQYAAFLAEKKADGSWAGSADPGAKAKAPATDLAAFPKLTDEQLAEMKASAHKSAPAAAEEAATVQEVRVTSAGTSVTTYDPAPGFTPEQLVKKLRAQGKASVRVVRSAAAGGVTMVAPGDCSYGSARTSADRPRLVSGARVRTP